MKKDCSSFTKAGELNGWDGLTFTALGAAIVISLFTFRSSPEWTALQPKQSSNRLAVIRRAVWEKEKKKKHQKALMLITLSF